MKKIKQLDIYKKSRKTWDVKPMTKVKPSKKIYNRKKQKISLFEVLMNAK